MAEEVVTDAMGNATGYTVDPVAVAAAEKALADGVKLQNAFAKALDIGYWEMLTSEKHEMIAARTPDQVIDAFIEVKPEWAAPLGAIKNDEELKGALHGALAKDPSMLEGFAQMASDGAAANPEEFLAAINDPVSRNAIVATLNKIAEKPDDKFNFADFKYLYDNRNDKVKALAKMQEMGINPTDLVSGEQMFTMLREALMSPTGFRDLFTQLPAMMGLSGEQAKALTEVGEMLGNYLDLCLGTKQDGLRALANEYGDDLVEGGKDFFERASGQRDEEIAAQKAAAGQGTVVDPATHKFAADLGIKASFTDPTTGKTVYEVPADKAEKLASYDQQTAALSERKTALEPMGP